MVVWVGLVVFAVLARIVYSGYHGDIDYQSERDFESCLFLLMALPLVLVCAAAASPFFALYWLARLARMGVDKYGRSKKNRLEERATSTNG